VLDSCDTAQFNTIGLSPKSVPAVSARPFGFPSNAPKLPLSLVLREKKGGKYDCSHVPPAEVGVATRSRRVDTFEKCSQLGRRPELRNGFQFLEGRGERIRQAPHRPRGELLMLRIEVGHFLRHSYRAWLDETGAPLGVQQKLMRHANISTTMNVYGGAFMDAKRKANTSVVQRVLSQKHSK
jgi:integrase